MKYTRDKSNPITISRSQISPKNYAQLRRMNRERSFFVLSVAISLVAAFDPIPILAKPLKKSFSLIRGSRAFELWSKPEKFPAKVEFYFFDIKNNLHTNASGESIVTPIELGGKPILEEKGPYVYRKTRYRSNFTFNDDRTELGYLEEARFEFDSEASNGTEVQIRVITQGA